MLRRELISPRVRTWPRVPLGASRCRAKRPRRPGRRRDMPRLVVLQLPRCGPRDLTHKCCGWTVCLGGPCAPPQDGGRTQGLGILYIIVRARARAGLRLRHEARAHCSTTSPLALTDRSMPSEGSHTVTIRCPATRSASACSGRFAPGRLHDSGVAGGASSATSGGGGAYTVGSCRCVSFSRSSAFRSLRAFFSFFSVFSFFSLFSFLALRFSCLRSFLRSRFRRSRPELLLLLLLLVSSSSRLLRFWCFCLWRSASGRVSLLTALVVSPQQSRFLWSTTIAIDARRLATEKTWRAVLARVHG